MSKKGKTAKTIAIMIILGFFGRILGFFRELLIGSKFGSNAKTDTYFVAIASISLFTVMVTNTLNTIVIPILSDIEKKDGKLSKIRETNNILNIFMLVSLLLIVISYFMSPYIMKIVGIGFKSKEQYELGITLMRIGLPTIFFASIQGVLRGYLQSEESFKETSVISYPFNLIQIIFLIVYSTIFGVKGLMIAFVIATGSQIFLQIYSINKFKFKYSLYINLKSNYIKKIMYLIPGILLSIGITDLNTVIDKSMASTLKDGSISALNYAEQLAVSFRGILIGAILTVTYPIFSKEVSKSNFINLKKLIIHSINIILIITIPSTIAIIILSEPIIKIVFERGKFNETATLMTCGALVYTIMRMTFSSIRHLIQNVFYSLQDTKTPLIISSLGVVINVSFNFILIGPMEHRGIALATGISAFFSSFMILFLLKRKIGSLGLSKSLICTVKCLFSSIIMGVIIHCLFNILLIKLKLSIIISFMISTVVGGIVYLLLIYFFKIEEFRMILDLCINYIKKRKTQR
ncbi:MAG: murein biosynthesis integral membrane protein MurJ [Fusobacteria bacterium]|nr:murein biosynthesis integral membrane protein MurJ [Fusobacteriota bacterium]